MTEQDKLNLILRYKGIFQSLKEQLGAIPSDALDYRPQSDFWTIREHAAHMLDAETYGFIRYRKAVAQPGQVSEVWNENDFMARLNYPGQDLTEVLGVVTMLTQICAGHLLQLIPQDWELYTINHPERGVMNLEKLLNFRISHTREHMEYIRRNINFYDNR